MCTYQYDDEVGCRDFIGCPEVREMSAKVYTVEKAMSRIVKQLYSQQALDIPDLDDAIGEICDSLGYQMPATMPTIRRSGSDIFEFAASMNQ